jgi:hypothetical membrane protein
MTVTALKTGNDALRDTRRNVLAASALLLAVATFVVAEAVTAAAWDHPAYSYANDFVSDLGVSGPPTVFKGHAVHSPLAVLLNTAFIVNGALVVVAAALLLRPRGQGRLAQWHRRLLIGYGLGLCIAAILHEAPDWMLPWHAFGATLAIGGGNIAVFLTGRLGGRLGLPSWLARVFTGLGAVGLAFFLIVQALVVVDSTVLPHGIGALERVAAYPLLLAQLVGGLGLLVEAAQLRRRDVAVTR